MASSRVLTYAEAVRAPVRRLGKNVYYGARPGRDGQLRLGKYYSTNGPQRGMNPYNRRAVGNNDGG